MNINQILKGIDKTQTEDTEGWWETSVGAEFGAAKLAELRTGLAKFIGTTLSILERAEIEMHYAGWGKPNADNVGQIDAYGEVVAAIARLKNEIYQA